jgi:hypothetical protein
VPYSTIDRGKLERTIPWFVVFLFARLINTPELHRRIPSPLVGEVRVRGFTADRPDKKRYYSFI